MLYLYIVHLFHTYVVSFVYIPIRSQTRMLIRWLFNRYQFRIQLIWILRFWYYSSLCFVYQFFVRLLQFNLFKEAGFVLVLRCEVVDLSWWFGCLYFLFFNLRYLSQSWIWLIWFPLEIKTLIKSLPLWWLVQYLFEISACATIWTWLWSWIFQTSHDLYHRLGYILLFKTEFVIQEMIWYLFLVTYHVFNLVNQIFFTRRSIICHSFARMQGLILIFVIFVLTLHLFLFYHINGVLDADHFVFDFVQELLVLDLFFLILLDLVSAVIVARTATDLRAESLLETLILSTVFQTLGYELAIATFISVFNCRPIPILLNLLEFWILLVDFDVHNLWIYLYVFWQRWWVLHWSWWIHQIQIQRIITILVFISQHLWVWSGFLNKIFALSAILESVGWYENFVWAHILSRRRRRQFLHTEILLIMCWIIIRVDATYAGLSLVLNLAHWVGPYIRFCSTLTQKFVVLQLRKHVWSTQVSIAAFLYIEFAYRLILKIFQYQVVAVVASNCCCNSGALSFDLESLRNVVGICIAR